MGQSNSNQVIKCLRELQLKQIISQRQVQNFIEDLKRDEPWLSQVKNFKDSQLQTFLKYFVPFHYPSTLTQSSQCTISVQRQSPIQNQIQQRLIRSIQKRFRNKAGKIKQTLTSINKVICTYFLKQETSKLCLNIKQIIKETIGIEQFTYFRLQTNQKIIKYRSYTNNSQSLWAIQSTGTQKIKDRLLKIAKSNISFGMQTNQIRQIFQNLNNEQYQLGKVSLTQLTVQKSNFLVLLVHSKKLCQFELNRQIQKQWLQLVKQLILASIYSLSAKGYEGKQQTNQVINGNCGFILSIYLSCIKLQNAFLKENLKQSLQLDKIVEEDNISKVFNKIKKVKKFSRSTRVQKLFNLALNSIQLYQRALLKAINKIQVYSNQILKNKQEVFIQISKYQQITFINCNIQKFFLNIQTNEVHQIKCADINPFSEMLLDIFQRYQNESFNDEKLNFSQQNYLIQTLFDDSQKLEQVHMRISLTKHMNFNKYYQSQAKISNISVLSQITNKCSSQKLNGKIHYSIHSQSRLSELKDQLINPDFNAFNLCQDSFFSFIQQLIFQMQFSSLIPKKNYGKINNFLKKLNLDYDQNKNPFHNFRHGINVMQTCNLIINMAKNQDILSDTSKFTLIISALCHDVGHTGYSNAFQVATSSSKAQMFNDISPLQNYHIFTTLSILKCNQNNFIDFLDQKQYAHFRKLLISNILFTDVKQHFSLIKSFEQHKSCLKFDQGSQAQRIFCGMIMHTSDFGGSAKHFLISQKWSQKVNQQFSKQSFKQKQLKLSQSPFMLNLDNKKVLAGNEYNFLKIIVQPLYKCIDDFFNVQNSKILLGHIQANIQKWSYEIQNSDAKNSEQKQNQKNNE